MSTLARIAIGGLIAVALVGGIYRWGATATNNKHAAQQLEKERQGHSDYRAEVGRGDTAVDALTKERDSLAAGYQSLQEAFNDHLKRNPIIARRSVPPVVMHVGPAPAGADAQGEAIAQPGVQALQACADSAAVDGNDMVLSNSAVWMWNTALFGTDRPAGACGAADQSEEACAAESGTTLEEAWRNHAINAQLCAEDRLSHQRLIDFIRSKKQ